MTGLHYAPVQTRQTLRSCPCELNLTVTKVEKVILNEQVTDYYAFSIPDILC